MITTPIKPKRPKLCQCQICKRGRRLERIANKLPARDKEWLLGFGDYVHEVEQELAALRAYVEN